MDASEISGYRMMYAGVGDSACFICGKAIRSGQVARLVPTTCDDTEKMRAGLDYESLPAHESCLKLVP